MRWIAVILFCTLAATICADPDPKKYKSQIKDKKPSSTSLTDEERKFLREVEAKFGIKSDVPLDDVKTEINEKQNATDSVNVPFPAVIAIEIVNDTDSNTKGKRTIDANLGYGYKTNNGYTYTYFGKQPQDKGKFMIYPYSQQDIPPARHQKPVTVEITPSRAYELVEMNDDKHSYSSKKHSRPNYENIKGLVSPPPLPHNANPTFYTTYNGHEFSALTGQFPTVMSNYLVDSSQLLKNPQYQSAGISQDYLRSHGSQIDHKVVPVLVLRVPSSYLKKPTAELYSSLPNNYPVSHFLNNINLQELVNNYFKKIGYTAAPQVMAYQSPALAEPAKTLTVATAPNYERQNYASPYVHPSYTHSDYSGVQYSAVQPVMAKYPTTYSRPQYYIPMAHTHFHQASPQYEYTYQYMPQPNGKMQGYIIQTQYQTQMEAAHVAQNPNVAIEEATASPGHAVYGIPNHVGSQGSVPPSVDYGTPQTQIVANHAAGHEVHYETAHEVSQDYAQQAKQPSVEYTTAHTEYATEAAFSAYNSPQSVPTQYGVPNPNVQKETLAIYDSNLSQQIPKYIMSAVKAGMQGYYYQKQMKDESAGDTLILTENYPSKDHTLATVLPVAYTRSKPAVQIVSYVTPAPHKYQSPYKVMVPQTVLKNPATEKVMYVNSHSLPTSQVQSQEYNPEEEYTLPAHYAPPVSSQKSSYPRNYHVYGKRNAKPANKSETTKSQKRQSPRSESNKQ